MTVELTETNGLLTLKLARPEVRNAFDDEMIGELTTAFEKVEKNNKARALIFYGDGESFCAGADLNWMKSMVDFNRDENIADSQKLYNMFAAMEKISVPIIGKVHGHAMGGALGLVALCDVVATEKSTQFSFSEVRLGLAPAVISSFIIQKVPRHHVHRYFLTGEIFDANQAVGLGLSHFVGSQTEVNDFVNSLVKKICSNGPHAVKKTKRLIQNIYRDSNPQQTIELIADLRVSDEGQEGLKAFFEKRKPLWLVNS